MHGARKTCQQAKPVVSRSVVSSIGEMEKRFLSELLSEDSQGGVYQTSPGEIKIIKFFIKLLTGRNFRQKGTLGNKSGYNFVIGHQTTITN